MQDTTNDTSGDCHLTKEECLQVKGNTDSNSADVHVQGWSRSRIASDFGVVKHFALMLLLGLGK